MVTQHDTGRQVTRRALTAGVAWAVPVVGMAAAAPAFAASTTPCTAHRMGETSGSGPRYTYALLTSSNGSSVNATLQSKLIMDVVDFSVPFNASAASGVITYSFTLSTLDYLPSAESTWTLGTWSVVSNTVSGTTRSIVLRHPSVLVNNATASISIPVTVVRRPLGTITAKVAPSCALGGSNAVPFSGL